MIKRLLKKATSLIIGLCMLSGLFADLPGLGVQQAYAAPTWQAKTTAYSFTKIAYGNNVYLAITGKKIYKSTDLVTWTEVVQNVTTKNLNALSFVNGKFFIGSASDSASAGATIMTSNDGDNWTAVTWSQSLYENNTTFRGFAGDGANNVFASSEPASGRPIYSTDGGTSWIYESNKIFNPGGPYGISYAAGHYVGVGDMGGVGTVVASQNSTGAGPWNGAVEVQGAGSLYSVANDGSRFVAVGASGKICYSDDINSLPTNIATSPTAQTLQSIAYGGGEFVAVGFSGTVIVSSDGINWNTQTSNTGSALSCVIWNGNTFVACGNSMVMAWTNPAGSLTVSVAQGTAAGSTKATIAEAATSKFVVNVTDASVSIPNVGDAAPPSVIVDGYTSGNDITTGVAVDKYLQVYDVDSNGKVVKFYQKKLAAADINAGSGEEVVAVQPDGTGADADHPIIINEPGNLIWMSEQIPTQNHFAGKYFLQTADIDMSGVNNFVPIGNLGGGNFNTAFRGIYDGNNHKIINLELTDNVYWGMGLFGAIDNNGIVKNLELKDASIICSNENVYYVGALVGWSYQGEITNCHITGTSTVTGCDEVGGIVGEVQSATIENCSNAASVTSTGSGWYAGGMVGAFYYKSSISNCYNIGTVTCGDSRAYAGGIVGDTDRGGNIEHCYNAGTVSGGGGSFIAGIAGSIGRDSQDPIPVPVTLNNNFFLNTSILVTSGVYGDDYSGHDHTALFLVGREADVNMKTQSTFKNAGWDFAPDTGIWTIVNSSDHYSYPYLRSMMTNGWIIDNETKAPGYSLKQQGSAHYSGGGGGDSTTPALNNNCTVISINNQPQDIPKNETTTKGDDGRTTATATVDDNKLNDILNKLPEPGKSNNSENKQPVITIPVNTKADVIVGQLNGQTVKNMETKEAVLEIKTDNVSYILPASQINIDNVSTQIGEQVQLKDIKVNVSIATPPADTTRIVEDTANKNNYQVVVRPVEFEITCTSGNKTVEVSKFNGYVERTVAIPDGVDPSKITTGVVLNADGTFSHVPTAIVIIDGKYYARINSLTNSTYSVIWHPVEFADMNNHWAKETVNDMGSRLVVSGYDKDTYNPDKAITRAEFASIVVKVLGLRNPQKTISFSDVTIGSWYYEAVRTAYDYGIISGYADGTFRPNAKITREEAMAMLNKAMAIAKLDTTMTSADAVKQLTAFADGSSVSAWAKQAVAVTIKSGIVNGSNGKLSAKSNVTRAETAVMVRNTLKKANLI